MAEKEFRSDAGKSISMKVGLMGANEAMGATLEQTACFRQNTFNIANENGEELEIKCEGGVVVETATQDGNVLITGDLHSLSDRSKFWKMTGNKVTSLVNDDFMSVEIAPDRTGAQGMRIPKAQIKAGIAYNTAEGWRMPITIKITKTSGKDGYYWEFFDVGSTPETGE